MIQQKYISFIATELGIQLRTVQNIENLVAEGATIPFIARYRKEATGNADEVVVGNVTDKIKYYNELEKRKETVLKSITEAGKLTPELAKKIEECIDAARLEDLYLPYKPKRKTRAGAAIEKGLQPLAEKIFEQPVVLQPENEAVQFLNKDVADVKEALQGARDIIAEWVTENGWARQEIRGWFADEATITAKVLSSKKEEPDAQKYKDYFEYSGQLSNCPSHRLLAIRRGEKEGFLMMEIGIPKEAAIQSLKNYFVKNNSLAAQQVQLAVEDGYSRLLKPSIETEYRLLSKNTADEEAIQVFAENLRQLLLASPLGPKNVLAIDPGYRTGCKVVCIDEGGSFLHYTTIFPHAPQNQWEEAKQTLLRLVKQFSIEAIAYGNGTASSETDQLVRSLPLDTPVAVFMVNESGASIYSASEVARDEFPDQDVTVRGAISIGRRLLDPLSELVKIDPKSIGVGQYQHDVNQTRLKEMLDQVVASCVNYVGVDLNTASKQLLSYVSGVTTTVAKNIVEYRAQNGKFHSREELKKVPLLGAKTFEQCAGFLRIRNAAHPLDNTAVHPESYGLVDKIAAVLQCNVPQLIAEPSLRKKIPQITGIREEAGTYTLQDILAELDKPGRDPRPPLEEFRFAADIKTMEDLLPGMELPGIITNVTNFGAFVNVGVKQDGLIHVSELANKFVSDPKTIVKLDQKIVVKVLEVDIPRKRIQLSMKQVKQPSRQ